MSKMWGIGAYWGRDKSVEFQRDNFVEIGWDSKEAPALYEMFSSRRLFIKAVGIAQDKPDGGKVKVEWLVKDSTYIHDISEEEGRYNVYNLTLYEEMNPTIRWKVKGLLDRAREQKQ